MLTSAYKQLELGVLGRFVFAFNANTAFVLVNDIATVTKHTNLHNLLNRSQHMFGNKNRRRQPRWNTDPSENINETISSQDDGY